MSSIRHLSIRHLDALLGSAWAWDDDDDDDAPSGPATSPSTGEPERESPSIAR